MNWYTLPTFIISHPLNIAWGRDSDLRPYINRTVFIHQTELDHQIWKTKPLNKVVWDDIFKIHVSLYIESSYTPKIVGFVNTDVSGELCLCKHTNIWEQMYANDACAFIDVAPQTIFFEIWENRKLWLISLANLINNLSEGGSCIFCVSEIVYKFDVDVLFLLTTIFNRVYIVQTTSVKNMHYIVCKCYMPKSCGSFKKLYHYIEPACLDLIPLSLFNEHVPVFFRHKLEEILLSTGSRHLEYLNREISLIK